MSPTYDFRYGSGTQSLRLPASLGATIVEAANVQAVTNAREAVLFAIRNPEGSDSLYDVIRRKVHSGREQFVIVVGDDTRKNCYPLTLPTLLDEIERTGVEMNQITILIGGGNHKPMPKERYEQHLGAEVIARVKRIVSHNSYLDEEHEKVGRTDFGNIVKVNKLVADCQFLIACGNIVYHYFAGFGGGRKTLIPGAAHHTTIDKNHSFIIDPKTGEIHRKCQPGILTGNPVHEDLFNGALFIKPDFIMDAVMNCNDELCAIFAGDISFAHLLGAMRVEEIYGYPIPATKFDLVIAGAGGYPKDATFYQAHKALDSAARLCADKGIIIFLAECIDGAGHAMFEEWKSVSSYAETRELMKTKGHQPGAHIAVNLRRMAEHYNIIAVSSLPKTFWNPWRIQHANNIDEALDLAYKQLGNRSRIAVIPRAELVTPINPAHRLKNKKLNDRE